MHFSMLLLIAVAVAAAIAVSFWVVNIATSYTGFEMLEVKCSAERDGGKVTVRLNLRNKGTSAATVLGVTVNNELKRVDLTVKPGEAVELTLQTENAYAVQVVVKTAGKEYPCMTPVHG